MCLPTHTMNGRGRFALVNVASMDLLLATMGKVFCHFEFLCVVQFLFYFVLLA